MYISMFCIYGPFSVCSFPHWSTSDSAGLCSSSVSCIISNEWVGKSNPQGKKIVRGCPSCGASWGNSGKHPDVVFRNPVKGAEHFLYGTATDVRSDAGQKISEY